VRQLLTESTMLSLAGGAFGLLFAAWTVGLLTTFVERFTPRTGEIAIDVRVLLFTAVVSIVTGILFGTLPATTSRVDLAGAMKQGGKATAGGGRQRVQAALIVLQVAVSVVILIGAGLLLTSFYRLQSVDPGYRADRVMSAELFTSNFTKYPDVNAQRSFYVRLVERLEAQPGVLSAAITNAVPLRTSQPFSAAFQIEGRTVDDPNTRPTADPRIVSAGFFKTLGVPLVRGRAFTDADDRETQPVVVINKAMMRYWDGGDPLGARISLDNGHSWATVVGIVGDVKQFGLDKPAVAQVYTPLRQTAQGLGGLVLLRANGDPATMAAMIRDAVWAIDADMPVARVRTLDDIRDQYLATPRLTAMLLTIFAALALLVTVAGITGVIATSVSQRTQEFGVRMALGASRRTVLRMVVREGLALVAAGLVIGGVGAVAVTRVLATYLFDTKPTDPFTFTVVGIAFVVAGICACLGPAWRATTVDPMLALRTE
jgi:predicted permease